MLLTMWNNLFVEYNFSMPMKLLNLNFVWTPTYEVPKNSPVRSNLYTIWNIHLIKYVALFEVVLHMVIN